MPFWSRRQVHASTSSTTPPRHLQRHLHDVVKSLEGHAEGQESRCDALEARCDALERALQGSHAALDEMREALAAESASRLALALRLRHMERSAALEMVPSTPRSIGSASSISTMTTTGGGPMGGSPPRRGPLSPLRSPYRGPPRSPPSPGMSALDRIRSGFERKRSRENLTDTW